MRKEIINYLSVNKDVKFIFTDYFDTIVHRCVHPNFVLRLWAKKMIQQLALPLSIDDFYFLRNESTIFLMESLHVYAGEIPYSQLISEIYRRLDNNCLLGNSSDLNSFTLISEEAEFSCEISVQFLNMDTVNTLKQLKNEGIKIYCISDFYSNENLIKNLIKAHGLEYLFDDVFVSAEQKSSKHVGGIYKHLMTKLNILPGQVIMIGDNYKSDVVNAEKSGIKAFHIPNTAQINKQKKLRFGNDTKDYKNLIKDIYKKCNAKDAPPYSDFIIFFQQFTEKLYQQALEKKLNNLIFLAREGLFLKRLFDYFQEVNKLKNGPVVKTHYLKMSRLAALQISFKPIEDENFEYFREFIKNLSVVNFLKNFNFSENKKQEIIDSINIKETTAIIPDFFESETYRVIKNNSVFIKAYEANRLDQKQAFNNYFDSLGVPKEEGINLVDIGWFGTMQDKLFNYFNGEFPVNGYYLGITKFRHPLEHKNTTNRKRGLNFEVNLFSSFESSVLMSSTGVYEQLAQAPHGSTIAYKNVPGDYTVEYFNPSEKKIYNDFIKDTQDFMFNIFKQYCSDTKKICYNSNIIQEVSIKYALKIGTIISKRKLIRFQELSNGFYNNIGNNDVGFTNYEMGIKKMINKNISTLRSYVISPEKLIQYVLRTKLTLYNKNKMYFIPTFPLYYYLLINRLAKKTLGKRVYLKYSHFR
ncbi:HAD family hydrolase [Tamlana haliotis]|uniref:HAD family hydrolase n=1 Tax=Pseudotamlana haliotis TaxID=2614804 RepID=A0A6N6MLY0_9FLAO|nr:HAD family hydrolase [Tamlana haliotis]KAB1071334.1 HAD family hydrolase [Tamlana haliotis]